MQPMAARLGVDHQQLQQFVTSSTWDHVEVRKRVASWADEFIEPEAYVIDDSGFPKDGSDSPGVARMYSGTLGKVGNCQIGVSVHAVTDWASAAIDWALFVPKCWDDTTTATATPPQTSRTVGIAPRSPRRCGIGRNGAWRSICSTRSPERPTAAGGDCPGEPRWPTPATATSPSSASACR